MECLHMSGAGNDFMVIDARGMDLDFEKLALTLCAQTGADGFMAVGESDIADFRLHFYNSDGTRGEMCGNGARCICKFAYDHGIAPENMVVQTDAGLVPGWRIGPEQYRVKLNNPGILDLQRKEDVAYVELGCPGVPHGVKEVPGLTWEQAEALRGQAKSLRYDPAFYKGTNINLYTWLDATSIRILTYERGVEDYTLACGTGSGSVAATVWNQGKLPGGVLTCHNKGGVLKVTVEGSEGVVTSLLLEGPAQVVGIYEI